METIVLAAGKGTRMRSELPKVLHGVLGKPVLGYVLETLAGIKARKTHVVIGYQAGKVRAFLKKYAVNIVLQREQKGTGHAVLVAKQALKSDATTVLICPGDMSLVTLVTLEKFIEAHEKSRAHVSALSCLREDPTGYGRIVREEGKFKAIREELDASEEERKIREVNTGVYLFDKKALFASLERIGKGNCKGEYYLTDTIEILQREGYCVEAFCLAHKNEGQGINSQKDLAMVTEEVNQREIAKHMESGVTFVAPEQTFVAPDVKIGKGTIIFPWCFIESNVEIGLRCKVGPFAKLREGTIVGDEAEIGSFVELNRSRIGKKVCAKHLAYLGDAVVGEGANIGAGVITANFDGKNKYKTQIGKNAMIGSNTVLVAPVRVPDEVKTGAGAVVTAKTSMKKGDIVVGIPAKPILKRKKDKVIYAKNQTTK